MVLLPGVESDADLVLMAVYRYQLPEVVLARYANDIEVSIFPTGRHSAAEAQSKVTHEVAIEVDNLVVPGILRIDITL
jgi:hypothetical protein